MAPSDRIDADAECYMEENHDKDVAFQTGGLSEFHGIDEEISEVVKHVENEIKEEIKKLTNDILVPEKLEIVGYRMNVVAGYMYYVKIRIPGDSFIHAKILETPTGEITLQHVHETKTDEDEKNYFTSLK